MTEHTTQFFFSAASWGIWAQITCKCYHFLDSYWVLNPGKIFKLSDKLYLSLTSNIGAVYFYNALYHNKETLEKNFDKATIFEITDMQYALCDYQDEVWYCVVLKWLNERYKLNLVQPEISYNKECNKYLFDILPLMSLPEPLG
jgi:hypothetical protein